MEHHTLINLIKPAKQTKQTKQTEEEPEYEYEYREKILIKKKNVLLKELSRIDGLLNIISGK